MDNKILYFIYLGLFLGVFMNVYMLSKRPELKLNIIYYKTICSFIAPFMIIPCFLIIKSKVVGIFFNYKKLIRFGNIKDWFNTVFKYSFKVTFQYISTINIFFIFNSFIFLKSKDFNKEFIYYFIIAFFILVFIIALFIIKQISIYIIKNRDIFWRK